MKRLLPMVIYTQFSPINQGKDKPRSTKHTHKTKDRVTRTPLNTGGEEQKAVILMELVSINESIVSDYPFGIFKLFLIYAGTFTDDHMYI
jgi:hypothetical protein